MYTMKHIGLSLLLIFLIAFVRVASASEEQKIYHELAKVGHSSEILEGDDNLFNNMMGLERCDENEEDDEECFKRRMVFEAHLDYIYTQHHKP